MEFRKLFGVLLLLVGWQMTAVRGAVVADDFIGTTHACPSIPIYESVAYGTDMNIELSCQCRPDLKSPVFWFYKESADSLETRPLTRAGDGGKQKSLYLESRISIKVYSIIIHKARVTDSGLYICGNGDGAFYWGYDLDVQDSSSAYVSFQEHHQQPQTDLETKHLTAFTAFWKWSKCDRCDVRGEKRKIGFCYVNSTYLDPRYMLAENGVVSCGSHAVPENLKTELSDRRPEIFIKSCLVPCHDRQPGIKGTIKHWMHKLGKIKDYIPFLSRAPTEKHTHTLGSSLTLACPGAKPTDAVAWDKGNRRYYKSEYLIGQKTATRIYIDHGNNLNFRYVRKSDKATYYCWHQGQLKAGIKLSIQNDPSEKRKFEDSDSILALTVVGIFFAIFCLIFIMIHCLKCCAYNFRCSPSACIADMV